MKIIFSSEKFWQSWKPEYQMKCIECGRDLWIVESQSITPQFFKSNEIFSISLFLLVDSITGWWWSPDCPPSLLWQLMAACWGWKSGLLAFDSMGRDETKVSSRCLIGIDHLLSKIFLSWSPAYQTPTGWAHPGSSGVAWQLSESRSRGWWGPWLHLGVP